MTPRRDGHPIERFRSRFGADGPVRVARAPGRINLIGEHIDYNGLSVLPMAIDRELALAFRPRADSLVRVATVAPGFPPRDLVVEAAPPPAPAGDWSNYVRAAAGVMARSYGACAGFDGLIDSTIPVAAGLSSSSALVVASALALAEANGVSASPLDLAARLAEGEQYVGTAGGGMDQAICLAARDGTASRVDFDPLRVVAHPVPGDWRFLVAFSLRPAEKSGAARDTYNRRTGECRVALAGVAGAVGLEPERRTYRDLLSHATTAELLATGARVLDPTSWRRFRHVVTEAGRVAAAERAFDLADARTFGRLMLASHASLRDDYEVSTAELDRLVELAMEAGADGARLTGAGLGGCVVVLSRIDRAERVRAALASGFFEGRSFDGELADHLFVASPSGGARVE